MSTSGKPPILQNSLTSYSTSDPYQDSALLINKLKQEQTPNHSDGSQGEDDDDYDDNDRFLEELERENTLLEKELETLVQLKNSKQKENQQNSLRSSQQSLPTEGADLEKIEEKVEEEQRESYYYSNSEEGRSSLRNNRNRSSKLFGSEAQQGEGNSFGDSNMNFGDSGFPRYKFADDDDEEASQKYKEIIQSSPLRTSHLAKSVQDEYVVPESTSDRNKKSQAKLPQYKDKENISNNIDLRSAQSSASKAKSKKTSSPPKHEKMDKVSSLEQRLAGATKAIKALENELKLKNDKIQDLTRDVEKKNKLLESQQSNNLNESQSQKSNHIKESLTTIMRKKEKEMEKKLKEQDVLLNENKKYMTRLQELNAKLLMKVKELEEENLFLKANDDSSSRMKVYEDDNKKLKERLKAFEKENSQLKDRCEGQQQRLTSLVGMYDIFERKSEKFIQRNKNMTDTLLEVITKHQEWSNHCEQSVNLEN